MKKILIVLFITISTTAYSTVDLSTNGVFNLFPSQQDIVQSVYDNAFTSGYSDFVEDIIFLNLKSNPVGTRATNSFVDFNFGYYNAGDLPFTISGNFKFSPTNTQDTLLIFTDTDGLSQTDYSYKTPLRANNIGFNVDFLIDIYDLISTGLKFGFDYNDRSSIFTNMTTIDNTKFSSFNYNSTFYDINVAIPIYIKRGVFKHLFEIGVDSRQVINSNGFTLSTNNIIEDTDLDLDSRSSLTTYLSYTFGYEIIPYSVEFRLDTRIGVKSLNMIDDRSISYASLSATNTEIPLVTLNKNSYGLAVDYDFSIGFSFQALQDTEYVLFRAYPQVGYSLDSDPMQTGSTFTSTLVTDPSMSPYDAREIYHHQVYFYTPIGFQIYNSAWPVGILLATHVKFFYDFDYYETSSYGVIQNQKFVESKVSASSSSFDYDMKTQIGFFAPIATDFLLEGSISLDKNFIFESLDIRFTMPLSALTPTDKERSNFIPSSRTVESLDLSEDEELVTVRKPVKKDIQPVKPKEPVDVWVSP